MPLLGRVSCGFRGNCRAASAPLSPYFAIARRSQRRAPEDFHFGTGRAKCVRMANRRRPEPEAIPSALDVPWLPPRAAVGWPEVPPFSLVRDHKTIATRRLGTSIPAPSELTVSAWQRADEAGWKASLPAIGSTAQALPALAATVGRATRPRPIRPAIAGRFVRHFGHSPMHAPGALTRSRSRPR